MAVVLLDNLLPAYQTHHYAVDRTDGKIYAMTNQGWFHISESASIYPQQGTILLSNLKRKSDFNVLNTTSIAESTRAPASVVSLRTTPISGGSQPKPDTTTVIDHSLLTLAVEQKVYGEGGMIFLETSKTLP